MTLQTKGQPVFLPLLGAKYVATTATLARIAKLTNAKIITSITIMRPLGGSDTYIGEPWDDLAQLTDEKIMIRFNDFIAKYLKQFPAQYHLLHRRFKIQPLGVPNPYE